MASPGAGLLVHLGPWVSDFSSGLPMGGGGCYRNVFISEMYPFHSK